MASVDFVKGQECCVFGGEDQCKEGLPLEELLPDACRRSLEREHGRITLGYSRWGVLVLGCCPSY